MKAKIKGKTNGIHWMIWTQLDIKTKTNHSLLPITRILFCFGVGLTPPQLIAINGAMIYVGGFVTGFFRSRFRHSTAEPLRLRRLAYAYALAPSASAKQDDRTGLDFSTVRAETHQTENKDHATLYATFERQIMLDGRH